MEIDFEKIKALQEEIYELIEKRPELQAFQDEINKKLSKCNSQENRLSMISIMMLESFFKLNEVLNGINSVYKKDNKNKPKLTIVEE